LSLLIEFLTSLSTHSAANSCSNTCFWISVTTASCEWSQGLWALEDYTILKN
jgi:hypothetical protein